MISLLDNCLSEEDARWIAEARDSVRRLDVAVLTAIDHRNYTTADRLERQRMRLERGIAERLGLPRPRG